MRWEGHTRSSLDRRCLLRIEDLWHPMSWSAVKRKHSLKSLLDFFESRSALCAFEIAIECLWRFRDTPIVRYLQLLRSETGWIVARCVEEFTIMNMNTSAA